MTNVIDNQTLENIKFNIAQGWDTLQAIADCMPDVEQVETTSSRTDYPEGLGYALVGFDDMEQVRELAKAFNLTPVLLRTRDGASFWHVDGSCMGDGALDRLDDYDDDPNFVVYCDVEQAEDERREVVDTVRRDYDENDPDEKEDMEDTLATINENYDKLIEAIKSCDDEHFVVTYGGDVDNFEVIQRYAMQYHDNDVTTWAIGLIDNND